MALSFELKAVTSRTAITLNPPGLNSKNSIFAFPTVVKIPDTDAVKFVAKATNVSLEQSKSSSVHTVLDS